MAQARGIHCKAVCGSCRPLPGPQESIPGSAVNATILISWAAGNVPYFLVDALSIMARLGPRCWGSNGMEKRLLMAFDIFGTKEWIRSPG